MEPSKDADYDQSTNCWSTYWMGHHLGPWIQEWGDEKSHCHVQAISFGSHCNDFWSNRSPTMANLSTLHLVFANAQIGKQLSGIEWFGVLFYTSLCIFAKTVSSSTKSYPLLKNTTQNDVVPTESISKLLICLVPEFLATTKHEYTDTPPRTHSRNLRRNIPSSQ